MMMYFLFNTSSAWALSSLPERDGVVRFLIKDNYPCVYLNNGEPINDIHFSGENHQMARWYPTMPNGSSAEQCVPFDNGKKDWRYDTVLEVYIADKKNNTDKLHIAFFCIKQRAGQNEIVQLKEQGGCSDLAWKPIKDYRGITGLFQKFWDWTFNLNGYTK